MMTYKKLNFTAHKKDIKFLSLQLISRAIDRFNEKNSELYKNIDDGFKNEDILEVLEALNNILENCNAYCHELENVVPVLNQAEELLPPETKVLEDLPDLEKDSLGVDSGSKEAINLTPDHSEE